MPSVDVLWMSGPAVAQDLPAAPPGQPVKLLRLGPANVFASQTEFSGFCANLDTKDNIVYANAWATEPAGSIPGRVVTTGCIYLPGYTSINNMQTELAQMRTNGLPGVDVFALRDQYHGDLVVMYNNDSSCGLGYVGASVYGKAYGFSMVVKNCADSNFSDVHERGHNFGMVHDDPNAAGSTPSQPYGFGFCPGAIALTRRDPMVYPSPCGGSRVPYFGNPQDTHFGYPFGNATHDGAKLHRWAMPIVANFYPPLTPSCPAITLSPTTLTAGVVGTAYSRQLAGVGGTGPYTFRVSTGTLPAGVTLSTAGLLSGTPTTAGTSSFTVATTDVNGCTGSQAYSLTIACPTITLSPSTLPSGQVAVAYSQTITASGGTSPYTFSVTSGALPAGVTLTAAGLLSGTPTLAQTASFTLRATDARGCTGTRAYSVTIAPPVPPPCPTITLFPTSLPTGYTGRAYSQTLTASGGTAPYSFALISGALPAGLSFSVATISGTPTTAGTSALTFRATDAATCTGTIPYLSLIHISEPTRLLSI